MGGAHQEIAVRGTPAQVEKGCREATQINQDGLVLDDGVGQYQFHVAALAGGHLRFKRSHKAPLQVTALVDLGGAVPVGPEFGDTSANTALPKKWS